MNLRNLIALLSLALAWVGTASAALVVEARPRSKDQFELDALNKYWQSWSPTPSGR